MVGMATATKPGHLPTDRTTRDTNEITLSKSPPALGHAPAKYCAPVWLSSAHTRHADVAIPDTLRTITGCLRATSTITLPSVTGIFVDRPRPWL